MQYEDSVEKSNCIPSTGTASLAIANLPGLLGGETNSNPNQVKLQIRSIITRIARPDSARSLAS